MKLRLGEKDFQSMSEAKKYVMNLAKEFVGGEIHPGSEYFDFFAALWLRSPSWEKGLSHFIVSQKFLNAAFAAIIQGGKRVDFSLRTAIRGKDCTTWTKITLAMRIAIRPQVQAFKAQSKNKCELCDSSEHLEVDHERSFRDLMRGFIESRGGVFPERYDYKHSGWVFTEADRDFELGWVQYHQSRCSLRLLCHDCHQQRTLQQRRENSQSESE